MSHEKWLGVGVRFSVSIAFAVVWFALSAKATLGHAGLHAVSLFTLAVCVLTYGLTPIWHQLHPSPGTGPLTPTATRLLRRTMLILFLMTIAVKLVLIGLLLLVQHGYAPNILSHSGDLIPADPMAAIRTLVVFLVISIIFGTIAYIFDQQRWLVQPIIDAVVSPWRRTGRPRHPT